MPLRNEQTDAVTAFPSRRRNRCFYEDRFIMLGMSFLLRALVVCHCCREDDSIIRIISARRANAAEQRAYTDRGGDR